MTATPKLPNGENGETTAGDRCRCGKPRNPDRPDHCLSGHWMKSNTARGKALERVMREAEQQTRIISYRDQYLRDLDWNAERAPLHIVHYCTFLAEALLTVEHARQSKHAAREVAALLPKVQRLYSLFETFRRKEQDEEWGDRSLEEMIASLRELREQCDEWIAKATERQEWEREQANQSALLEQGNNSPLPTLHTRAGSDPGDDGSSSTVPATAGLTISDPRDLTPSREFAASPSPSSDPAPLPEPTPVLYVYGQRRVTERDVRRCLEDSGDLAAYEAGRISKAEAYRRTSVWMRHAMEIPR